jgi:uncharacterized protein YbjT (DUF2867 family)
MAATSTVLIAGATGFVGRALAARLQDRFRVIGLTRSPLSPPPYPDIEWRRCDLFSLFQTERALEGAGQAVYLVHSMLPSARFVQGSFQDMDLILADNFAQAASRAGVRHIVYLGGLASDNAGHSRHLASRLEVERTLGSRGVPVTALRAGVVIGRGGSSFEMMVRLVTRLRIIPCAGWARTPSQPIALPDLLTLMAHCLEHPASANRQHDIGGPDVLSYRGMLERVAAALGLRRRFVDLPVSGTTWCRCWLSLVTGAPPELVGPLLESMSRPMVAGARHFQEQVGVPGLPFDAAIRQVLAEERPPERQPKGSARAEAVPYDVRSVQRIPLPQGRTARWAAEQYSAWLPVVLRTLLRAETDAQQNVRVCLAYPPLPLLEHHFARERSMSTDRQVFYIKGGLLARRVRRATRRPRLEFREALQGASLIVAIHDYRPTLPWTLYRLLQAPIHVWVIRQFARHLARLG